MSTGIKTLISQTAIYGVTNMVGRFLNFLLVPLYTSILIPESFAVITVFYAFAGFVNVLLSFGMETAYFNFCRERKEHDVFSQSLIWIAALTFVFLLVVGFFPQSITYLLGYPEYPGLARWLALILAADALCVIPFARLRQQNKALRFGLVKLANVGVNIGLNLFFLLLCPRLIEQGVELRWYQHDFGVGYVFLSNLIASVATLIALSPQFKGFQARLQKDLLRKLLQYAGPLVLVGFAGMINELIDRILLQRLLPAESAGFDTGVYGAFYRLSIIITIFVQAFRFAAEPFFFEKSKDADARLVYARVMNLFVGFCSFIFLATMLFLDDLAPVFIRQESYFDHPFALLIVPILLMANIFLGIYYNLNIWYKLRNKTGLGAYISVGGALLTLALNFALIPHIGILGSAIATLSVYFMMSMASYFVGQHHYAVPYHWLRILLYLGGAVLFYTLAGVLESQTDFSTVMVLRMLLLLVFGGLLWLVERPEKKW